MFDNIGGNIVLRHEIPLEAILQPLWDVYVASKGDGYDFQDLHFSSRSHYSDELKSAQTHIRELLQTFNDNDDDDAEQYKVEKLDMAIYDIFRIIIRYLSDCVCCNKQLNQSIKETALLMYKQPFNQCTIVMKGEVINQYIDECNALITRNDIVAKFYSILMGVSEKKTFVQAMSHNYNCKSILKNAVITQSNNSIQIYSPIYNCDKIKLTGKLRRKRISANEIWINRELLRKKYDIQLSEKVYYYEIHDTNLPAGTDIIAIQAGKFVFPLVSQFIGYVKNLSEYIWTNILYDVYHQPDKKENDYSLPQSQKLLLEEFRSLIQDDTLVQKLSFLINNLYLPEDVHIEEKYKKFFSPVLVAKKLKHLLNYEFLFQESDDKSAMLATYQLTKDAGITAFNLLHILKKQGETTEDWTGPQKQSRHKMAKVHIFQPVIAFYFLQQFYEDYFKSALSDSYLTAVFNQKVQFGDKKNEIDIIVKGKKFIYFIELKTTLSVGHILKYREKCIKWMEACSEIKQYMKFVIAGCYGNDELLICTNPEINEEREGMASKIFDFSINIDNQKTLRCFTEPNYTKLKEKIKKIFV